MVAGATPSEIQPEAATKNTNGLKRWAVMSSKNTYSDFMDHTWQG